MKEQGLLRFGGSTLRSTFALLTFELHFHTSHTTDRSQSQQETCNPLLQTTLAVPVTLQILQAKAMRTGTQHSRAGSYSTGTRLPVHALLHGRGPKKPSQSHLKLGLLPPCRLLAHPTPGYTGGEMHGTRDNGTCR